MTQYVFGTGQLFAMPVGGGAPLKFGALQDVSIDFSGDIKQLHGQYQYALDVARGKAKIEWKASTGNIDVEAFNQIFFGGTVEEGDEILQKFNESAVIPATPFAVTVDETATFLMDLGVKFAATGVALKQIDIGGTPATGEYKVSDVGLYTFAASDTTKEVLIDYMYESASTGGSLVLSNQLMGTVPQFQLVLSQTYKGKVFTLILYSNVSDKLSLPLKQDDYLIAETSGQAFANDAGNVARITTTSVTGGGG